MRPIAERMGFPPLDKRTLPLFESEDDSLVDFLAAAMRQQTDVLTKDIEMKKSEIMKLPDDPVTLKAHIARLADMVASYEVAKAQRAHAAELAAASPAANFEIEVFNARADLEGISDGSIDYTDPKERGDICRKVISLLGRMFDELPKA